MTRRPMVGGHLTERGLARRIAAERRLPLPVIDAAPVSKAASAPGAGAGLGIPFSREARVQAPAAVRIDGGPEQARIGVPAAASQLRAGRALDDLAEVHDD